MYLYFYLKSYVYKHVKDPEVSLSWTGELGYNIEFSVNIIGKDLKALDRHLKLSSKNTGSWMTILVTTVTSAVLAAT